MMIKVFELIIRTKLQMTFQFTVYFQISMSVTSRKEDVTRFVKTTQVLMNVDVTLDINLDQTTRLV